MVLKRKVDVAIVGAGAGGAACAARLSERGLSVVILEEGGRFEPKQFKPNYGWALNHLYQDKGSRFVEAETLYPMPGGRGVGGSTLINSAICYRAPNHILEHWSRALGLEDLSPEKMAPRYDRVERTIGVVQMHPLQARANNLFVKRGAESLGLDGHFIHRNAPGCVGCGVCQLGCPSGGKGSVDRNFIPEAEEQGAEVFSGVRINGFKKTGEGVTGVHGVLVDIESGEIADRVEVDARAVVLAAGAINTPLLMLKEGLGERAPHIGQHLAIHPSVGTFGFVPEAINSWNGVPQAYAIFLDRVEGILLQTYNAPPEIFFSQLPWSGLDGLRLMRRMKNLAMCGALVSDHGAGVVTVGRGGKAKIRYTLGDSERRKLLRGLRGVVQVLFAAGATDVFPGVGDGAGPWPTMEVDALAALHDDVPESAMHIYASHPMGTCRMGVDPSSSVVDGRGAVHGVPGLYISDASLMPSSLGVNPSVTIMALGLHVADNLT